MKSLKISILSACLLGLAACGNGTGTQTQPVFDPDAQQLVIGDSIALAQTQYGTVKGYICRGVFTFLGIPYGDNTAGENRFMPPQPPKPWDNVRPAVYYGDSAPQGDPRFSPESYSVFQDHWNYDILSEDCLRLNVWTPAIDQAKRPVIVWLHGGGFSAGNGIEQDGYHGESFARRENAVFVSINHRLNCFGFSDFASVGGDKYVHSGNVGMLDIIAALEWVHNNIAQFGGDPASVTIIGQSGGGSKVCTAIAMPAAKGLVHKAVALSGNSTTMTDKAYAEGLGAYILKYAGLKPSQIDKLQKMPWKEYYKLANEAAREYNQTAAATGTRYRGFSPVADDVDIPIGTFYTSGRNDVPDVPLILCTTANEFVSDRDNPQLEQLTQEDVVSRLKAYGENAQEVYDAYKALFPNETPFGILSAIMSSRDNVLKTAEAKCNQKSPVYMAWFTWCPPNFDGRQRAFHCLDISFWFNNTDLMLSHTGGGKVPRVLSQKMSDALGAFMRTGNPNAGNANGLPTWEPFTVQNKGTMILNNTCQFVNDPDGNARQAVAKFSKPIDLYSFFR